MPKQNQNETLDLFIIGGGINGCGIARDAAGRGMRVALAEMNDLASATSSSSTKLIHGGLRYLEYFEFRLVREALIERENLLVAMPHIAWPMRFILPYHKDMRFEGETPASKLLSFIFPWRKGQRPAWLIRLGLYLYDNLGGREILPGTTTLDLKKSPEGSSLNKKFKRAFEYSDCWVQDSRLVVLNAIDAKNKGAKIMPRTEVINAKTQNGIWHVTTIDQNSGEETTYTAKALINASGPWAENIIKDVAKLQTNEGVRLVRGSHIVTKRLFEHDKAYFFQGKDGRVIFAIPYEQDFTLIGTTDKDHETIENNPECTQEEQEYLCRVASNFFAKPISVNDIVWTYSGVRPLYDDNASSGTAATREYVLKLNETGGAPAINIFGGKITTYRKLAEAALEKLEQFFPEMKQNWTARAPLPGGDIAHDKLEEFILDLQQDYAFLPVKTLTRLVRTYGTDTRKLLGDASNIDELGGRPFAQDIYAAELDWGVDEEWVQTAQDFLWRRTKLGLQTNSNEQKEIARYIQEKIAADKKGLTD